LGDKIAVMGAGALGSYVEAFLSREGQDVTFIDMWPEHVEAIRRWWKTILLIPKGPVCWS
jgi:2-dehydropantoate 2-reductase